MTGKALPVLKARQVVRVLERLGFSLLRKSKGSHRQYQHSDGRRTTVPFHRGQDIGPGLLRKILRDIEVDVEEFRAFL